MILDWLSNGFSITFKQHQPAFHQGNRPMTKESREFITGHIQELLLQGAIERTQTPTYCISPIATLPKKNGKRSIILNLNRLNQCVVASRFRYEKPGHTAGDHNQATGVASWTCKTVSCGTVAITIIASLHSDYQPDRGQS